MRSATLSSACSLRKQGTGLVRAAVPWKSSSLAVRKRTSMATFATKGQILRGHGEGGWAEAGWDIDKHTLSDDLQRLVLTYGELAQATYDNVGTDRSSPTFGYSVKQPGDFLAHLTDQSPLAPGAAMPQPPWVGTSKRYTLPAVCDDGLSPLIHARPGKSNGNDPPLLRGKLGLLEAAADKVFDTVAGVLVTVADGSNGGRRLFVPNPETGRGVQKRGTFFGYVAVSEPAGPEDEVDVAFVWRGTNFKEEWESNVAQDKLTVWSPDPSAKAASLQLSSTAGDNADHYKAPKPTEVGVHDGFDDLYNRRTDQPVYTERVRALGSEASIDSVQADDDDGIKGGPDGQLSPREVLRKWLFRLLKRYNVTTITCTGHSLGGGVATLTAFGVADLLERQWDSWEGRRKKQGWKTMFKPKVSLFSFASPRVGNYTFGQRCRELGVAAMRVVNNGDVVPNVPGVVVQGLSYVVEAVPVLGKRAAVDMDSGLVRAAQGLYHNISKLTSKVYPDKFGYFHIGQVLQLDVRDAKDTVNGDKGPGGKHNLELHLHLVSRMGQPAMQRNPLLLNKFNDLWTNEEAPADWWGAAPPAAPLHRGCHPNKEGRWTAPKTSDD